MADVSYLRAPSRPRRSSARSRRASPSRRRRRGPWLAAGGAVLTVVVLAVVAIIYASSKASLGSSPDALATIKLPMGGGSVTHVSVVRARDQRPISVETVGDPKILPRGRVAAGQRYEIQVVVKRPGWISWLSGKRETLTKTITTPAASVRSQFVTLGADGSLRVRFTQPVRAVAFGARGHLTRHALASPRSTIALPHTGSAGTTYVAATRQTWETASPEAVSWFPHGTRASAVATPAPGHSLRSDEPITLTFSKSVSAALGSHLPTVSPAGSGSWHRISDHAIVFRPTGYGYGLGQKVTVALPAGVRLAGGTADGSANGGNWKVPAGSTARLQQLLAGLGYLPVRFHYAGASPALTIAAEETAAISPPTGHFDWRWSATPSALQTQWQAGSAGAITEGAVMMFEEQHGMTSDGVAGPQVWKALFQAAIHHDDNGFGYTFVQVSEGSPESLEVWHSGRTVVSGVPVNTGVAGAATATGTYPVFEHAPSVTMIGTNVDGTKYNDPGIKWVSYFNGGDALHAYPRASYGFPQSNGCVEMDEGDAASVYPFTPIGTLVDVE